MSEARKKNLPETNLKDNFSSYLKGVRAEWDKVTWPEKKQVFVEVIIVLLVVFFFTLMVYLYDVFFNFLFSFVF